MQIWQLLIPDVKASCTRRKATSVSASPRLSLESDKLDRLITQNRSNLADKFGGKSPHEIFEAFLNWNGQSLLDLLVNDTNRYAKEVRNDPTLHVDYDEIKVLIGIILRSGYHRLPGAPLYWDTNTNVDITCNIVTNAMSKTRFQTTVILDLPCLSGESKNAR